MAQNGVAELPKRGKRCSCHCLFLGAFWRAMQRKKSFYIFCVVTVAFMALCVWAVVTSFSWDEVPSVPSAPMPRVADVPPSTGLLAHSTRPKPTSDAVHAAPDFAMEREALENGATPTQDVGERGSRGGVLVTKYPLTYHDSRFERIPDSPLYIFTEDMVWKAGENEYEAKREALADQARHIQEASVALSVSPRVEYGKTTGFRLVEIPEGTLFSRLGMVSGDTVVSINGTVPDMEPMALMFVNMAAGRQGKSTIVVDHGGTERTIELRAVE